MDPEFNWQLEYQKEIGTAISARENGNEGMARVCARRATGIIIGEYLYRRGYTTINSSVRDRITIFNKLPNMDYQTKEIVSHFLLKVDTESKLPAEVDLIADAEWLFKNLLVVEE
jgi:hypothetical protein